MYRRDELEAEREADELRATLAAQRRSGRAEPTEEERKLRPNEKGFRCVVSLLPPRLSANPLSVLPSDEGCLMGTMSVSFKCLAAPTVVLFCFARLNNGKYMLS